MLKRITKLSNIGCFTDASCGGVEFGPLSYIFGRNTYGKSTLADLFASIQSGEVDVLRSRRTIPHNKRAQIAKLSFLLNGQTGEKSHELADDGWRPHGTASVNFCVFGDSFYYDNVFASRQFDRNTKENLSAFIIGAAGVAKARTIAEMKKDKRAATSERTKLKRDVFGDIERFSEFLALSPFGTIDEIKKSLDDLRNEYRVVKKRRSEADRITARSDCQDPVWNYPLGMLLDDLNAALASSLESHHQAARQAVSDHIGKYFKDHDGAESWIRTGVEQNLGQACQFCGQALGEEAMLLMGVYQNSFDTAYRDHQVEIGDRIETAFNAIKRFPKGDLLMLIESNRTVCASYPELADEAAFGSLVSAMEDAALQVDSCIQAWCAQEDAFIELLEVARQRKQDSPHAAIPAIPALEERNIALSVKRAVAKYSEIIRKVNKCLAQFRASVEPAVLDLELAELKSRGDEKSLLLKRAERTEQVDRYGELTEKIDRLSSKMLALEEDLAVEQSEFLDRFFVSLNRWFKVFGSSDFGLEKGSSSSGYTPVYYLKVTFRGKPIPEKELPRVLSGSDRKALALAVFWAGLSNKTEEDKKDLIVVLDDPVTSFDDGRITAVHQEIVRLRESVRQVVVLSHYQDEVARFLNTYQRSHTISFIVLERKSGTSLLKTGNVSEFLRSEHERKAASIRLFVKGDSNTHNAGDLRIFFEGEIESRFAWTLESEGAREKMLGEKIDALRDCGAIKTDVAAEAHRWRQALNSNHHSGWGGGDIEDQRNTARRFVEFVYTQLNHHGELV